MKASLWRNLLAVLFCLCLAVSARGAAPSVPHPDLLFLQQHDIATDNQGLLAYLRERSPDGVDLARLDDLVRQLGDDSFEKREEATRKLTALELHALPLLRKAVEDKDPEVRRTAFLLSLHTRPKLVAALRERDPELRRQLVELDALSEQAEKQRKEGTPEKATEAAAQPLRPAERPPGLAPSFRERRQAASWRARPAR